MRNSAVVVEVSLSACSADKESVGVNVPPDKMLNMLGFEYKRQQQYVSSLSGGERRRLHLASILAMKPNLLILDEPTNDLDLSTIEVRPCAKDCVFFGEKTSAAMLLQISIQHVGTAAESRGASPGLLRLRNCCITRQVRCLSPFRINSTTKYPGSLHGRPEHAQN